MHAGLEDRLLTEYSGIQDPTEWSPYSLPQGFATDYGNLNFNYERLGNKQFDTHREHYAASMQPFVQSNALTSFVLTSSAETSVVYNIKANASYGTYVRQTLDADASNDGVNWLSQPPVNTETNNGSNSEIILGTANKQQVLSSTQILTQISTTIVKARCGSDALSSSNKYLHASATDEGKQLEAVKQERHKNSSSYFCDECSRGYASSRSLAIHKRTHSGLKPYRCSECDMRFNQWNVWSTHLKGHSGTKDHICPMCKKAFLQSGHLFTHVQNHQNIKKHGCEICKKRFIGKGDLIRHQRSHTGEKPFSCSQCAKCFSRKESLKYHVYLHNGVRPHKCPLCARGYTKMSTLKTHFMKVHDVGDLDSYVGKNSGAEKSATRSTLNPHI